MTWPCLVDSHGPQVGLCLVYHGFYPYFALSRGSVVLGVAFVRIQYASVSNSSW